MSPSEFDLRAALRDGEGDGLNVDHLVEHARARVAQRRVHLLSGGAIAAVVAAIGVGGALLANSTHDSGSSGAANAQGTVYGADRAAPQASAHAPAAPAPGGGGAALSEASASAVPCPRTPPHYLLPGGGSPGQFGASGPLFKRPVSSVVVCAYGVETKPVAIGDGVTHPARLVLRDGAATSLVTSLESAPKTPTAKSCPYIRSSGNTRDYAFIGITADAGRAGTVTTTISTPGCGAQVTNGTAVRYDWSPPAGIGKRLAALTPSLAPKSTAAASPTR